MKQKAKQHQQLVEDILKLAKKQGADIASVHLGVGSSLDIEVRQGEVDILSESQSSGVSVTVSRSGKRSSFSSNDLSLDSIQALLKSTMESLPHMQADEYYTLPDSQLQGKANVDLELEDIKLASIPVAEKIQCAKELETLALKKDYRLQCERAFFSDSSGYSIYGDSNGFLDITSATSCAKGLSLWIDSPDTNGENQGRKQSDGWYSSSRFYSKLENNTDIASKAIQRTLQKLDAIKPQTCEAPVIFDQQTSRSFWKSIASALMGGALYRKQSFLLDCLNQTIAESRICLYDDPLLPQKLGSRYFDGEGVTAKPLSLIENGVLKNYMLSTYSANKLDMITTGHSGGLSNLILQPGDATEQELVASISDGLYITSLKGQGTNITTGDYSQGAEGRWIRNGKFAESVCEITIAGKLQDMLKNISMIASEVEERSAIQTPAFKIQNLAISGQ